MFAAEQSREFFLESLQLESVYKRIDAAIGERRYNSEMVEDAFEVDTDAEVRRKNQELVARCTCYVAHNNDH